MQKFPKNYYFLPLDRYTYVSFWKKNVYVINEWYQTEIYKIKEIRGSLI